MARKPRAELIRGNSPSGQLFPLPRNPFLRWTIKRFIDGKLLEKTVSRGLNARSRIKISGISRTDRFLKDIDKVQLNRACLRENVKILISIIY